jgi:hypothetical protein
MVLRSNLFFSPHAVWQKMKSPVDLAVGLARSLHGIPPGQALVRDLGSLGQSLADPPTIHGWPTGADWINTISLAGRLRLSHQLLHGKGAYKHGLDPWGIARQHGCQTATDAAQFWLSLLVPGQLSPAVARTIVEAAEQAEPGTDALRRVVGNLVSLPEFQLN